MPDVRDEGDGQQHARQGCAPEARSVDIERPVPRVSSIPAPDDDPQREEVGQREQQHAADDEQPRLRRSTLADAPDDEEQRQDREEEAVEDSEHDCAGHALVRLVADAMRPPARKEGRTDVADDEDADDDGAEDDESP